MYSLDAVVYYSCSCPCHIRFRIYRFRSINMTMLLQIIKLIAVVMYTPMCVAFLLSIKLLPELYLLF